MSAIQTLTIDLNTALSYFLGLSNLVFEWMDSKKFVIGHIHFTLWELTLSIIALEVIWWFFLRIFLGGEK